MNILVVCTGNICRSPTAEAVLRKKLSDAGLGEEVHIDSADFLFIACHQMPFARDDSFLEGVFFELSHGIDFWGNGVRQQQDRRVVF